MNIFTIKSGITSLSVIKSFLISALPLVDKWTIDNWVTIRLRTRMLHNETNLFRISIMSYFLIQNVYQLCLSLKTGCYCRLLLQWFYRQVSAREARSSTITDNSSDLYSWRYQWGIGWVQFYIWPWAAGPTQFVLWRQFYRLLRRLHIDGPMRQFFILKRTPNLPLVRPR